MVTRTALHKLVDELREDQVDDAAELLDAYRRGDRLLIQLLTAPLVAAEPDEIEALAELTEADRNDVVPAEELKNRLGIA